MTQSKEKTIAIVDLECTCDDSPAFDQHEIIEIGAVIGNLSQDGFSIVSTFRTIVKPTINPVLSDFCTQLTGITQNRVNEAEPLQYTLVNFDNWIKWFDIDAWASWGKSDANLFSRECELKSLINPLANIKHLNLKQLFARKFGHRVGLKRALTMRGLAFIGSHHSGIDDAKNVAKLVANEGLLRGAIISRLPDVAIQNMSTIDPPGIKKILQDDHLRQLMESSPDEKSQIILKNSGFAAAIHRNRKSVSVKFGK